MSGNCNGVPIWVRAWLVVGYRYFPWIIRGDMPALVGLRIEPLMRPANDNAAGVG